jgi:hypothetical protein
LDFDLNKWIFTKTDERNTTIWTRTLTT